MPAITTPPALTSALRSQPSPDYPGHSGKRALSLSSNAGMSPTASFSRLLERRGFDKLPQKGEQRDRLSVWREEIERCGVEEAHLFSKYDTQHLHISLDVSCCFSFLYFTRTPRTTSSAGTQNLEAAQRSYEIFRQSLCNAGKTSPGVADPEHPRFNRGRRPRKINPRPARSARGVPWYATQPV